MVPKAASALVSFLSVLLDQGKLISFLHVSVLLDQGSSIKTDQAKVKTDQSKLKLFLDSKTAGLRQLQYCLIKLGLIDQVKTDCTKICKFCLINPGLIKQKLMKTD